MGNNLSDDESAEVTRKAIIPFRVRNNGFQVDYKIFKFRNFTKAKVDEATDTKYDDSFLELNTRSKIVGDIRKVLTISAENISEEYATLRKNYFSRIVFGMLTFFVGLTLTNIGLVQSASPQGRIMMIFGGLLLMLTLVTLAIIIYTDRRLKGLNRQFVTDCVKILEKEKIVTWTASFQHLLFDIIYPYNGKGGVGAVILTPNPYFEMISQTTDDVADRVVLVNDPKTSKIQMPVPQWAIDESVSNENEEAPLIHPHGQHGHHRRRPKSLIYPPSDQDEDDDDDDDDDDDAVEDVEEANDENRNLKDIISCHERSSGDDNGDGDEDRLRSPPHSDADNEHSDHSPNQNQQNKAMDVGGGHRSSVAGHRHKTPPPAYKGFDVSSKENAAKIHGDLIQRFFHENPEDIEGHGEETALMPNMPPQPPQNDHNQVK
mmetsp:Transcript_40448/g.66427  ORF Transcript_40448/g.66427 Transcript_40448/m.66427 type:complete len:432 (-) Transcript_40448:484-1779(-)|eukprot:CAMPEP_0202692908 /NCGR_PEP_ID=MMETSP1385-20130828/7166_1 /ASSEMBLY_ACC=CAM_ASM_000861 /TAXON_ID=933848 /ORGANISM="Elphidium margaritaceum" /LENGTH=431 /DNA_ID=CAMNT_0049348513 /DNA_START=91 /DNA_END=1386 /DNA_ORIENTATION=-